MQVYDVGRAINPTLVEGQIEGGAMMGLGLGLLEEAIRTTRRSSTAAASSAPTSRRRCEDLPELDNVIIENPSEDGPFGAKAIGEMANNAQPPAIVVRDLRRGRRLGDRDAGDAGAGAARRSTESKEPRRDGKRVIFDEHRSRSGRSSSDGGKGFFETRWLSRDAVSHLERREAWQFVDGVAAARDRRRAGAALPRHVRAGQAGAVARARAHRAGDGRSSTARSTMTIEDETATLKAGDVVVVNRGVAPQLYSESGVTFIEALAPVPLDHVPDRERDLVLGPDGGSGTSSAERTKKEHAMPMIEVELFERRVTAGARCRR